MNKKSILILSLLLLSCNVAKREQAQLQVLAVRYPDNFKLLANQLDPCYPEKARSDTIIKIDTLLKKSDTITKVVSHKDTVTISRIITKPGQLITRNITIHDTVVDHRLDASCDVVKSQLLSTTIQLQQSQKKNTTYLWYLIGIGVVCILYVIARIKKLLI